MISTCASCNTQHVLVAGGSSAGEGFLPVSFLPYQQKTDGRMKTSLLLMLGERIREKGLICHSVEFPYLIDLWVDDEGKVCNRVPIADREMCFMVGMPRVVEVVEGFHGLFNRIPVVRKNPIIHDMYKVSVIPVTIVENGISFLIGHRVVVDVLSREYEAEANDLSVLIQEWFGIKPEVVLANG